MADELSISTTNQAGDGWVDQVPGPVSSGYQAQNTLISSTLIGIDKSEMIRGPAHLRQIGIAPSGPIDVDGQPYMITQRVFLRAPIFGYYYVKVVSGSTWDKKTLVAVRDTDLPVYDHIRRGLYFVNSDGTRDRCLNWKVSITRVGSTPFRIPMGRSQFHIENFLDIDGLDTKWGFQFAAGEVALGSLFMPIQLASSTHGKNSVLLINKSLAAGGTFKISFTATPSGLNGYNYTIEELPHGSSTRIVKGRRQRSGASIDNFSGTYSFSPYSLILLYADLGYRGVASRSKNMTITNFKVGVSRNISPLMRHLLNLNDF